MRFPMLAGLVFMVGCGQLGEILDRVTLTDAELQEASDNYAGAIAAFKELESFAIDVSEGAVNLDGVQFTAPEAANGWVGTIQFISDQFPGGSGELDLDFAVVGPDGPMDPFLVDTTNDPVVTTSIQVSFSGQTSAGADLVFDANFTIQSDRTDPTREVITTDGWFRINHNGYVADLTADQLRLVFDPVTGAVIDGSGAVRGVMEIPGYTFPADVDLTLQGTTMHVLVEVLNQTIEDSQSEIGVLFGTPEATTP